MPGEEYGSLQAFYRRRDRRLSMEVDYGVHWRAGTRSGLPEWRVSYVRDTGEVYATPTGDAGRVRVLGVVDADPGPCWYATLDRLLSGWQEPDVTGRDLGWVERRLASRAAVAACRAAVARARRGKKTGA